MCWFSIGVRMSEFGMNELELARLSLVISFVRIAITRSRRDLMFKPTLVEGNIIDHTARLANTNARLFGRERAHVCRKCTFEYSGRFDMVTHLAKAVNREQLSRKLPTCSRSSKCRTASSGRFKSNIHTAAYHEMNLQLIRVSVNLICKRLCWQGTCGC